MLHQHKSGMLGMPGAPLFGTSCGASAVIGAAPNASTGGGSSSSSSGEQIELATLRRPSSPLRGPITVVPAVAATAVHDSVVIEDDVGSRQKTGVITAYFITSSNKKKYFAVMDNRIFELHESEKAWRKQKSAKYFINLSTCFNVAEQRFGKFGRCVSLMTPDETLLLRTEDPAEMTQWYASIRQALLSARTIQLGHPADPKELFLHAWDVCIRSSPKLKRAKFHEDNPPNICEVRPKLANQKLRLCVYRHALLLCDFGVLPSIRDGFCPPLPKDRYIEFSRDNVREFGQIGKYFFFRYGQSFEVWLESFSSPCKADEMAIEIHLRVKEVIDSENERQRRLANSNNGEMQSSRRFMRSNHHRNSGKVERGSPITAASGNISLGGRSLGGCSISGRISHADKSVENSSYRQASGASPSASSSLLVAACDACQTRENSRICLRPADGEETEGSGDTLRANCNQCQRAAITHADVHSVDEKVLNSCDIGNTRLTTPTTSTSSLRIATTAAPSNDINASVDRIQLIQLHDSDDALGIRLRDLQEQRRTVLRKSPSLGIEARQNGVLTSIDAQSSNGSQLDWHKCSASMLCLNTMTPLPAPTSARPTNGVLSAAVSDTTAAVVTNSVGHEQITSSPALLYCCVHGILARLTSRGGYTCSSCGHTSTSSLTSCAQMSSSLSSSSASSQHLPVGNSGAGMHHGRTMSCSARCTTRPIAEEDSSGATTSAVAAAAAAAITTTATVDSAPNSGSICSLVGSSFLSVPTHCRETFTPYVLSDDITGDDLSAYTSDSTDSCYSSVVNGPRTLSFSSGVSRPMLSHCNEYPPVVEDEMADVGPIHSVAGLNVGVSSGSSSSGIGSCHFLQHRHVHHHFHHYRCCCCNRPHSERSMEKLETAAAAAATVTAVASEQSLVDTAITAAEPTSSFKAADCMSSETVLEPVRSRSMRAVDAFADEDQIQVLESIIIEENPHGSSVNELCGASTTTCNEFADDDARRRTLSLGNTSWLARKLFSKRKSTNMDYITKNATSKSDRAMVLSSRGTTATAAAASEVAFTPLWAPLHSSRSECGSAAQQERLRRLSWRSVDGPLHAFNTISAANTHYTTTVASTSTMAAAVDRAVFGATGSLSRDTISPSPSMTASICSITRADNVGNTSGRFRSIGAASVSGFPLSAADHERLTAAMAGEDGLTQSDMLHNDFFKPQREQKMITANAFIRAEDIDILDQITGNEERKQRQAAARRIKTRNGKKRAVGARRRSAAATSSLAGNITTVTTTTTETTTTTKSRGGSASHACGSVSGSNSSAAASAFGFETIDENISGRNSPSIHNADSVIEPPARSIKTWRALTSIESASQLGGAVVATARPTESAAS